MVEYTSTINYFARKLISIFLNGYYKILLSIIVNSDLLSIFNKEIPGLGAISVLIDITNILTCKFIKQLKNIQKMACFI